MSIDGCSKRRKEEWERTEYQAWLTAYYTAYSVGLNFNKKVKFPDNPLNQEKMIVDTSNMDEEELAKVHEDFLEKLDLMAKASTGK